MRVMIIRLKSPMEKEEIEKREKELSEKLDCKVVLLGREYGDIEIKD